MNTSRSCPFCGSNRLQEQRDSNIVECWDCGQQISENNTASIWKRTILLRRIEGKWHYCAVNRKRGLVFYIDPPDDFFSKTLLEWSRHLVFKNFEEITLIGEGTKGIMEEFKRAGERFGRHNFRVISIWFSESLRYSFVADGIDDHGPAKMIFDKREMKFSF